MNCVCNTREGRIAWNCIVFVLFNGKWLKDFNVFCVNLFYWKMKEGSIVSIYIMFCYIFLIVLCFFYKSSKDVLCGLVFGVGNPLLPQESSNQ
jgi:hypothetical protein